MEDVDEIVCSPEKPGVCGRVVNWFCRGYLAMVVAGLVGFIATLVWEWITGYRTPTEATLAFASAGLVVGLLLMRILGRWERERWHWVLTPSELIVGKGRRWRRSLSSITKIVPCAPIRTGRIETTIIKVCKPELYHGDALRSTVTLLLKFSDGTMLPFNVHACTNGTRLMTELLNRCQGVVDCEHEYTPAERRALHPLRSNRPTRPRRAVRLSGDRS